MGYNTVFTLTYQPVTEYKPPPNCEHAPKKGKFCPECGKPVGSQALDDMVQRYGAEFYGLPDLDGEGRWYEHDKDMRTMSKAIPNVLFKLHGEGSDNEDIWDAYYLNGKGQKHRAKIVIAECDPKAWK